ncbi:carbohydrate ABC transporter permease [Ethanoligenens harbinense]|uniref:Binding-protein-dependent transport systems inner membrane component n=1 Tax=Ethanoligenens harbinense (strain DSM 18485 / JCM 12961 / CGMCC 1.5033 / YUAN-3) TaxID=663278 RepID=E6U9M3_ETHHY|nr:sugar ABC transporter permease [Ethanoligenens harbinense]ADU27309.1 binding-protein-dependent transport systems inner membrane component [Ethanoligenens harbinense YUAN-3]AVQ96374.1 sugar ABC transporter permease [Ethanoligenens harbinense YUAN-3]AYF39032.1 sugar ABC transporter permease [Ethanoligenens harbinense]AYF41858.1 sugar ABC transporter permease [Ethanoligenens harbinense]QCN92615.1 sugar ABC transporter permease [Ethanoligenens harbinense]
MNRPLQSSRIDRKNRTFLAILIPIMALFFLFNTLPLLQGFSYSFTNFRGFGSYNFVGLRNFVNLFQDGRIGHSYQFTFLFAVVTTILVNVLSLILALGLNAKIRIKSTLRGIYFIPAVLGGLVVGYIFNFFFTYILPTLGKTLGSTALGSSLLSNPKLAWIAIVVVVAWQAIAMNTIIYISGLQTVPQDVYEAGALDGATGWKQFQNLTLPLIMPFVTINMVLCMKNFLMVFDQIMSLTQGGPAQSTEPISYLIYNNGLGGGQFGYQSANAVLFFVVIVAISVFQLKFLGDREEQL